MLGAILSTATFFREKGHQTSGENIPHAQAKQQRDHNRHHQVSQNLKVVQNMKIIHPTNRCIRKSVHSA